MHHRFLPISMERGRLSAGRAWCGAGREAVQRQWSATRQFTSACPIRDIRTQLSASGCSHLPPPHPAIYLSLPRFSLAPLPLSLSLFLIFLSKTDPTLSSRAWPAAVPLLKEQRNDLISPPLCLCGLLSLLIHRSLHTEASFSSPCEGACRALTSQPRHGHCRRSIPVVWTEHAALPK